MKLVDRRHCLAIFWSFEGKTVLVLGLGSIGREAAQRAHGLGMRVIATRKRLFSSTVYVFVIWMVGTSLILFFVATIFMRNQVKPIRRLAIAAENFGKGRDMATFKSEGATEVRQASTAFLAMPVRGRWFGRSVVFGSL